MHCEWSERRTWAGLAACADRLCLQDKAIKWPVMLLIVNTFVAKHAAFPAKKA